MRKVVLIIITFLVCGCGEGEKNVVKIPQEAIQQKKYKSYFSFDQIEHYAISDSIRPTFHNDSLSQLDYVLLGTLKGIQDTLFLDSLELIGFQKKQINSKKYYQLNKVFSEKKMEEYGVTECIAIYRDILVFREKRKIIGLAKICFECQKYNIVGTNADISTFPINRSFQHLKQILGHKKR